MKKNNKGFAILYALIFTTIVGILSTVLYEKYNSGIENMKNTYFRIEADNYAKEGIELVYGYIKTSTNKDKTNGWDNNVRGLSGNYKVTLSGDYSISTQSYEEIYEKKPYWVIFKRYLTISNGLSNNEKIVKSKVYYNDKDYIELAKTIYNYDTNF